MRLANLLALVALLVGSTFASADSVVAGSNLLALSNAGAGLCPSDSDCEELAQQFMVSTPVLIDGIKVVLSGPDLPFGETQGNFSVSLGSALGSGIVIGTGDLPIGPSGEETQEFDFTNLDISLSAGTYYLQMTGQNLAWNHASALTTSLGSLGPEWACDPSFLSCSGDALNQWQSSSLTEAVEIDGTAIAPEPSTLALFGTGLLIVVGEVRRRVL